MEIKEKASLCFCEIRRRHTWAVKSGMLEGRSWDGKARNVPGDKSQDLNWYLVTDMQRNKTQRFLSGDSGASHFLQLYFYVYSKFSMMIIICFNNQGKKQKLFKRIPFKVMDYLDLNSDLQKVPKELQTEFFLSLSLIRRLLKL